MPERAASTISLPVTRKARGGASARSMITVWPGSTCRRKRKCVSRWAAMIEMPASPGLAEAVSKEGPNASASPPASASTMACSPRAGTESRATGQVSAQGHGVGADSPSIARAQALASRTCAISALAPIQTPCPARAVPAAIRASEADLANRAGFSMRTASAAPSARPDRKGPSGRPAGSAIHAAWRSPARPAHCGPAHRLPLAASRGRGGR